MKRKLLYLLCLCTLVSTGCTHSIEAPIDVGIIDKEQAITYRSAVAVVDNSVYEGYLRQRLESYANLNPYIESFTLLHELNLPETRLIGIEYLDGLSDSERIQAKKLAVEQIESFWGVRDASSNTIPIDASSYFVISLDESTQSLASVVVTIHKRGIELSECSLMVEGFTDSRSIHVERHQIDLERHQMDFYVGDTDLIMFRSNYLPYDVDTVHISLDWDNKIDEDNENNNFVILKINE